MKKWILGTNLVVGMTLVFLSSSAFAVADSENGGTSQTFTITGYYSPLPTQEFFLTGSYESEVSLNGNGTNGADGTPVYPGMIAAPSSYPFGTKVCIPGFGCGTVHDRGGAIVHQGERSIAQYDRLDLWMGYGDEGLRRALAWGLQHLPCERYPVGADIADSVNFEVPLPLAQIIDLPLKKQFKDNLSRGDKGEKVRDLQEALAELGFYSGVQDGTFSPELEFSVLQFQKKHFIVASREDVGAGAFGPLTREKLMNELYRAEIQKKIQEMWESFSFDEDLSRGAKNASVMKLQQVLVKAEFLETAPTGFFGPQTEAALIEFQLANGIIPNKKATGAGKVGEVTRAKLNALLASDKETLEKERTLVSAYQKTQDQFQALRQSNFSKTDALAFGSSGDGVSSLQASLQKLGYLNVEANGYFGKQTQEALRNFQLDQGVIFSDQDSGAGIFDSQTKMRLLDSSRG